MSKNAISDGSSILCGIGGVDTLELRAKHWSDYEDDLPLSYWFAVTFNSGETRELTSISTRKTVIIHTPRSSQSQAAELIQLGVNVVDHIGGKTQKFRELISLSTEDVLVQHAAVIRTTTESLMYLRRQWDNPFQKLMYIRSFLSAPIPVFTYQQTLRVCGAGSLDMTEAQVLAISFPDR